MTSSGIADHVGQEERDDRRRMGGPRQLAALEAREVLPHRVQLVDGRAALEEEARHRLLLRERDRRRTGAGVSADPPPEIRQRTRSSGQPPRRAGGSLPRRPHPARPGWDGPTSTIRTRRRARAPALLHGDEALEGHVREDGLHAPRPSSPTPCRRRRRGRAARGRGRTCGPRSGATPVAPERLAGEPARRPRRRSRRRGSAGPRAGGRRGQPCAEPRRAGRAQDRLKKRATGPAEGAGAAGPPPGARRPSSGSRSGSSCARAPGARRRTSPAPSPRPPP